MITKSEIEAWFDEGKKNGYRFMLVLCDTFDYEDFPSYAKTEELARKKCAEAKADGMVRIMEIYDLDADREEQVNQRRCFALQI